MRFKERERESTRANPFTREGERINVRERTFVRSLGDAQKTPRDEGGDSDGEGDDAMRFRLRTFTAALLNR